MSYLSVILINNVGFSHRSFSIFASIKKKKKIRKLYWFLFYVLMLIVKRVFCLPVLLNLKDKTFESPLITYIVLYALVGRAYFIVHILSFFRFRLATNGSYFLFLSACHWESVPSIYT